MQMVDINPHIRYAEQKTYTTEKNTVYVRDCRLFYVLDGLAEVILEEQRVVLRKNSVFYCCGDKIYTIKTIEPLQLLILNFDLSQRKNAVVMPLHPEDAAVSKNKFPIDKCIIEDSRFLNAFLLIENCAEFKGVMANIVKEFTVQKTYYREYCSSLLKNLLIEMHRNELQGANSTTDALNRVIDYIVANFTTDIKNSELAAIAGYHEYYLNRLFIKYTGLSMHQYIINLRINEAKNLLLNTDMPLADIAFAIGFNSSTHFSNYFSKKTRMTPSEYRNNLKNKI